jgi:environmental stress-induced protein Ves
MISLLRAADRPRIPWKNGGGEAEDIATGPPGASWESMDWRVSRAWIAASGPFSVFPGIDRTFMVADGAGVELTPSGVAVRLGPASQPFPFPGDVATGCVLLDGPVVAFNVMSARGRWRHRLDRRRIAGETRLAGSATVSVAVLLEGTARMLRPQPCDLGLQDAISLAPGDAVALDAGTGATIAWVELWESDR